VHCAQLFNLAKKKSCHSHLIRSMN
jgi:hypothetical protein